MNIHDKNFAPSEAVIRYLDGDYVVVRPGSFVRCAVTGTHRGRSPVLDLDPTGRRIAITGIWIARVADGRIAEAWNNFDFLSLYLQLGLTLR